VFQSTFLHSEGPEMVKNLDTEAMMKFFSQEVPALIVFYDSESMSEMQLQMMNDELDIVFE
jgi:hypothetical protein